MAEAQICNHDFEKIEHVVGGHIRCTKCDLSGIGIWHKDELVGLYNRVPTFLQDESDEGLYHVVEECFEIVLLPSAEGLRIVIVAEDNAIGVLI